MLSFFKKTGATISDGEFIQISKQYTNTNEVPVAMDAAYLQELGYSSETDLRETIYGTASDTRSIT